MQLLAGLAMVHIDDEEFTLTFPSVTPIMESFTSEVPDEPEETPNRTNTE